MVDTLPGKAEPLAPRETRLSDDLSSYITELTRRAPGTITFRTGSGRILRDLLIHWPTLDGWETQAQALCSRIVDAIYPLAGVTYAQAMEVSVTISPNVLAPPKRVNALAAYAVFDAQTGFQKLYYLNPREEPSDAKAMLASGGVAVVGRPLNVFYHTLKDDRRRFAHIRKGMYELPQSMINALYEEPPFISTEHEKKILASMRRSVNDLPRRVMQFEQRREAVFAPRRLRSPEAAAIAVPAVTALSALPPPVRAAEHRLMGYAMDRSLSPEFRLRMRRVAQELRETYPQAIMTNEARAQLTPRLTPTVQREPQFAPAQRLVPAAPVLAAAAIAPSATPSLVASPIGSPLGPSPATPSTAPRSPSPGVEASRLVASDQINQPQLPLDRVEPDRAGAPRAGLQPEERPVETPEYRLRPPAPLPRRPEPQLPDSFWVDNPALPRRDEREERPERRAEARPMESSPKPQSTPDVRELQPRVTVEPVPRPSESAFAVLRRRPEPERDRSWVPRVETFRNEERPRNAYETLLNRPDAFPRMVPVENSGRLQKTMQAQLIQNPQNQPQMARKAPTPRIQPWMFPSPSPAPFPRNPRVKGK